MEDRSPAAEPPLHDLVVAGGGAAGFFAAITFAEARPGSRVLILEKSREVLGKVRISGGGRCNVTHAQFDPKELSRSYPRGSRQLIGPLHRWGPADTIAWFENRGVPLKTEADGRVFPQSDSSSSIIDCLLDSADEAGVEILKSSPVTAVDRTADGFWQVAHSGGTVPARHLLLTLGGTRNRFGADLAARFGHRIEEAAPSLFTFKIDDPIIDDLQGLSVEDTRVHIPGLKLASAGPVLITHWGLSGPGILKLSAWGARELQRMDYRFEIVVNWCGDLREEAIIAEFDRLRVDRPRRKILNDPHFGIPSRLWKRLVTAAAGSAAAENLHWPHLPKPTARLLAERLGACRFRVDGKSINKDEFVTCGGVHLGDVDFRTMESRKVENLHFAGEILDIDGITGGFNFQSAWTTGRIAGEAIAAACDAFS